jgi:hypothetical protein
MAAPLVSLNDVNAVGIYTAENDLSGDQYLCVEVTGAAQVDTCDGAGDVPIGILLNKPTAGQAASVSGIGSIVTGTASAAITAGAKVGTTAAGKLVTKSADEDYYLGIAIDAAAADGDLIRIYQTGPLQIATA